MNRSYFTIALAVVFIVIFSISVTGQNNVNKSSQPDIEQRRKNLDTLQKEFEERDARQKSEAEAYALKNNIPMKMNLEDGGFAELQKIADGVPIYYRTFNSAAAASTRADFLNTGGGMSLDLNGNGLIAHIWDGGHARVTHQDYDGPGGTNRVTLMDTGTEGGTQLHYHAAHVTGTVCAEGVATFSPPFGTSKGMAWQSQVRGYKWNNDVAEATSQAGAGGGGGSFNNGYDMLLSNHSYGYIASSIPDAWFGQYGSDAVDWDNLMYNAPYYLMVVAAGNDGNDNASNGIPLSGNAFFDKLSGHATAKNNMVVANGEDAVINGDGSLNSVSRNTGSSEGPTDDFRIKPDIMGNGTSLASTGETSDTNYIALTGTSMASPNVTGSLLLLQEHYYDLNTVFMRSATLKGLALHTADDVAATGPDAETGWGLMNSKAAAEAITNDGAGTAIIDERSLSNGASYSVDIESNGVDPLFVSISWTDPAGTLNTGTNSSTAALVNDLDLRLTQAASTSLPWRLTGVNTNGVGDNLVDPYERVDITGASGIYTLTVTHKGTLSSAQDFTIIVTGASYYIDCPGVTKIWNGSSWSPAGAPGATDTAVINGNYDTATDGNLTACKVTVNAGSTLTVNPTGFVSVEGDITVDGNMIVEHTGNVVQTDDSALVVNNGNIDVYLTTPALNARDFMIMGSPMTAETNVMFSAHQVLNHTTANFTPYVGVPPVVGVNFHDQESNDWSNFASTFNPGEGYLVRPSISAGGTYNYTYNLGTLNNGEITYNAFFGDDKEDSPNVLSNPYASAIDADLLISSNAIIDELYFWEHLTTPGTGIPGPLGANFSMEDISTRNFTMGIPASNDPGSSTTPNGVISTGQGFGIKANAAGLITFNNALRLTSGNTTLRQSVDKDLIWITVREPQYHMGSTAGIGFTENATPALDQGYDTMKLGTVVSLYSHLADGSQQLGIQGRESFDSSITIPMGFSTQIEVDGGLPYIISIANLEGNNIENVTVYLVDHLLNITTNLSQRNYEFVSNAGNFDNRFTLQFEEGVILGTSENNLESIAIFPNPTKNVLQISSPKTTIHSAAIYDIRGRKVNEVQFTSEGNYQIDMSLLETSIYFVKITSESGSVTKRIIKQ